MATKRRKLTVKQEAAIDAEREATWLAWEKFSTRFTGLIFKAEVLWFDASSGEGMIRGCNGEGDWPLYACNIPGAKTWFPGTACTSHAAGQLIDCEIKPFVGGSIAVSHTPGTLDAARWAALDHSKLAFVVREDGSTTGLGVVL